MCEIPEPTTRKISSDFVVVLDRGNYTTCTIQLFGATITSWRFQNQEQLFVSTCAIFDCKKAIRGGIPIVFPHYGLWKLGPKHGFARSCMWMIDQKPKKLSDGDIEAIFYLVDNEVTRSMWNYPFKIIYKVTLGKYSLTTSITVENPSRNMSMYFDLLFHNYFLVPDVTNSSVLGLEKSAFRDYTKQAELEKEIREEVTFNDWTNRRYEDTYYNEHTLTNIPNDRNMIIKKYNLPDTVLWNPWNCEEMTDFLSEEYQEMICIMPGFVTKPFVLLPETSYEASQILRLNIYDPILYFY